jgi:hypothetical protein
VVSCSGRARLFDTDLKLFSDVEFQLQYGPTFDLSQFKYVYEVKLDVKDKSMMKCPNLLPVYLFSYDGVGSGFFPDIELGQYTANIERYAKDLGLYKIDQKELTERIAKWFQYLESKSGFDRLMLVAVEPMVYKQRLAWRVIDTELN